MSKNFMLPKELCKKCKKPLGFNDMLVQETKLESFWNGFTHEFKQCFYDYYHLKCLESRFSRFIKWWKETLNI